MLCWNDLEADSVRLRHLKEFAEAFRLNRDDLILSNAYIYEPYFGCMENLNCHVIFQEKYGRGAHRRDGGCDPGRRGQDQM